MVRGIINYFANKDGTTPVYPPEYPMEGDSVQNQTIYGPFLIVECQWSPADGYVVYRSFDGRSWDNGVIVEGTSYQLDACNETQYFRVSAKNSAGISFPTEVLPIQNSTQENKILIVSAFDRLQASSLYSHSTPVGTVKRLDIDKINGFDTAAIYGVF